MAEENVTPNQLENENKDQSASTPVYNPFLGLSYKQFSDMMAGDNPDAPLVQTDIYGNVSLHPENVGKSGPAQIDVNKYGQKRIHKTQKQALKEFQEEQQAVADLYGEFSPKFAKGYSKNALPMQVIHASGDFVDYAGKSFGSAIMNVAHGVLAQKRNVAEDQWKAYLSRVDNSDGSVTEAERIVAEWEEQGRNFQYANISKLQTTNKVKDILKNYKELLEARHEDERRMRIAALYEEEEGPYSRWAQNASWLGRNKELKGNKNSVVGMLTQLSGDVAGSLAFYYTFGMLTGGSTALVGRMLGAGSKLGAAMLSASTAVGEYAVFAPSFLSQYNSIRTQALMNGADIDTANAAGFWAGMFEGSLEMVGFKGFNRLYTKGGYLYNAILKGVLPEALQEGSQTFSEDVITNAFGITSKDFGEIMKDVGVAMLGGALGGGAMMSGRYRLEGMTAAGLRIVDRFHKTIEKHSAADVQVGVAQAKAKIQAENAPGVPPKEPPTGGAAAAVKEKESTKTVAAKVEGQQKTRLDEVLEEEKAAGYEGVTTLSEADKEKLAKQPAKSTGKEKVQEDISLMAEDAVNEAVANAPKPEAEVDQSQQTEEGTKAVAEAVYDMYNQMKKLATDKVRLRYGKKVSDEQIKQIWNAVSEQVMLQAQGNEVADAFNGQIDRALSLIDSNNKIAKENAKKTKQILIKKGFTKEQAERLTSPDWSVRHKEQWEVAKDEIIAMFERNGGSTEEGAAMAEFIKGLLFNTTFLNPQMKVSDIIAAMNENMINVQRGILHDQELPEMFATPLSKIKYRKFKSGKEARQIASDIIYQITQGNNPEGLPYIKTQLFGNNEVKDPELKATRAALEQQGELQEHILSNMEVYTKEGMKELKREDYMAIALLRFMGASQEEIDEGFGFNYTGETTPDQSYTEAAEDMFPSLNKLQLQKLENLSQAKKDEGFTQKQLEKLNKAVAFYETIEGVAVVREATPKPGTLMHEGGHMTMSGATIGGLELDMLGLLPKTNGVTAIINHIAAKMKRDGVRVTEEELQETVLDALARVISRGQSEDNRLTGLFTRLKEQGFKAQKQLSGSLMNDRAKGQRKGGNLTAEQKAGIEQTVLNILENKNAANQLTIANDFSKYTNFEMGLLTEDTPEGVLKRGQERLDTLRNGTLMFIDQMVLPSPETAKLFVERLYASKDLLGLAAFAHQIAEQAKAVSFDTMLNEAAQANGVYDESIIEDTGSSIMFMAEDNPKTKINGKREYNPKYKASFREQPKGLVESAKESFSYLELLEGCKQVVRRYLQSLEGATPNNMTKHLLMQQFFMFSERSQKASELIAKVVGPLDKKLKEAKERSQQEYEAMQRRFQDKFFAVLADGKKGAYGKSFEFIKEELGDEAAGAWADVCYLIKELTGSKEKPGLLEQAGISADLLNFSGDYFPLQVAEYDKLVTEYFGHSVVFNEIEKLKNRIYKQYERMYDGKIPPEKKAEIEVEINNKIGALFQRHTSDENALSSFNHKQLFNFQNDPSILNYYADPFDTVSKYLDAAYRTIMMRNLVGKVTYDENGKPNMDFSGAPGSLARYLSNLPIGSIGNQAINNFKEKLAYLAQRDKGSRSILDSFRKINQITTLGSVFNAINQGMDLAFAAQIFGAANTIEALKEVLGGKGIKISDVYAQSSNEVFRMQGEGILSRIGKAVFKKTGFEWADIKVKEVMLNASTKFFQQGLNSDPNSKAYKDAMYYVDQIWPDDRTMVFSESLSEKEIEKEKKIHNAQREMMIESLKKGVDNDYTRFAKWFMLTKTQPINAATVPAIYNAMGPFGKMCYQFSTVAVRQLEFLADRIQYRIRTEGKLGAAKEFAKLAMFLAVIGLPKELIENLLKGRTTDIPKTILFSPFHIFMINEYTVAVAKRDGLASAAATITAPSFGALDNVSRDVLRAVTFQSYKGNTFKSVPIFGWAAYWWLLGGREQNVKNKVALFDFSEEEKEKEDKRITSNLNFMETGEDK